VAFEPLTGSFAADRAMAAVSDAKTRTCRLLNIPLDIGHEIWEYIDDSATFRSLSLTSKALVPMAQQRIFHSLRFQPFDSLLTDGTWRKSRKAQLLAFKARLVGLARSSHLLSYVKTLSIEREYDSTHFYSEPDEFDFDGSLQNTLSECVSQMTRVTSISVDGFQLVPRLMDALLIVMERQPIRLKMESVSLPDPSWPITTTRLVEFEVNCGALLVGPTHQVVQHLARSSQETLRLLSITWYSTHTATTILSYSFPNLTSLDLSYSFNADDELSPVTSFLAQHPLLTCLRLAELPIQLDPDAVPMLTEIEGSSTTVITALWNKRPITTVRVYIETLVDLVNVSGTLKQTSGARITSLYILFEDNPPLWARLAGELQTATPNLVSLTVKFYSDVVRHPLSFNSPNIILTDLSTARIGHLRDTRTFYQV
jgi:hypothetical protein